MSRWVVDASVAVKWLLPEPQEALARKLLQTAEACFAPELIVVEVANALHKRVRRGELASADALAAYEHFLGMDVTIVNGAAWSVDALSMAMAVRQSPYDCYYLALAMNQELPLVTADRRFYQGLQGTQYASHLRWIEQAA